jgi:hypothetical protein
LDRYFSSENLPHIKSNQHCYDTCDRFGCTRMGLSGLKAGLSFFRWLLSPQELDPRADFIRFNRMTLYISVFSV